MKIDKLKKEIEKIKNDIEKSYKRIYFLELLVKLDQEPIYEDDNLDTIIYKKYMDLENVSNVAKWLNEQGYRLESPVTGEMIKYKSTDISTTLTDKKIDVRADLKEAVQQLFIENKNKAMKRW